ncbi:MAG TPA: DUF6174 domain-containing protein [Candidatus Sulfomarinibacteraceae bacterium]|nr:DUF6174 domain-containing protein [Candidatus Sulfomarinibacteraceae bacterium]
MTTVSLNSRRGRRRNWLVLALAVVLLAVLAAVGLVWSGALPGLASADGSGDSPLAQWQAQGLDSYRYTLQVGCFCIEDVRRPVVIEVREGAVSSVTYADDGSAADPALFESYSSVEALFAVIDDAAAQDPARLDVVYDQTTGVPLSINIDISEQMADEELYLDVSNFEAVE